jgi:hypothetical protein
MPSTKKGGAPRVGLGVMLFLVVALVCLQYGTVYDTGSYVAGYAKVEFADDSARVADDSSRVADGSSRVEADSSRVADGSSRIADGSSRVADDSSRVCSQNPYAEALTDPLDVIAKKADAWLDNMEATIDQTFARSLRRHTHKRFFPFDASMATCKSMECVGGPCKSDLSKFVCGLDELRKEKTCIVYSIGGNNQWDFEIELLKKTPCEIHTFDCTGRQSRFRKPDSERLHFHHVCLGTDHEDAKTEEGCDTVKCGATWTLLEMQQRLGHTRIDLLKLDIEGFEWPLLESWPILTDPEAPNMLHPMQLLVEIHYQTQFAELRGPGVGGRGDFKFALDMVNLQARFLRMGYVVVERDDNKHCKHCTELTLVRNRCPGFGVYAKHSSLAQESKVL